MGHKSHGAGAGLGGAAIGHRAGSRRLGFFDQLGGCGEQRIHDRRNLRSCSFARPASAGVSGHYRSSPISRAAAWESWCGSASSSPPCMGAARRADFAHALRKQRAYLVHAVTTPQLLDRSLDERAPREIVIDLDNTDIPLHGRGGGTHRCPDSPQVAQGWHRAPTRALPTRGARRTASVTCSAWRANAKASTRDMMQSRGQWKRFEDF